MPEDPPKTPPDDSQAPQSPPDLQPAGAQEPPVSRLESSETASQTDLPLSEPESIASDLESPTKAPFPAEFLTQRDLNRINRRELLKLTPLVLVGAFAIYVLTAAAVQLHSS